MELKICPRRKTFAYRFTKVSRSGHTAKSPSLLAVRKSSHLRCQFEEGRADTPGLSRRSRIEKSCSGPRIDIPESSGCSRAPVSPEELKFRSRRLGFSSESTHESRFHDSRHCQNVSRRCTVSTDELPVKTEHRIFLFFNDAYELRVGVCIQRLVKIFEHLL